MSGGGTFVPKGESLKTANNADSSTGCCSLGAAVQGWDETAVNGAQLVSLLCGSSIS